MQNEKRKTKIQKQKSNYENLQEDIRDLGTPAMEVFRNKYSDKNYVINLDVFEFSCICPKTGLPDYATINIQYIPDKFCIELKSFKLYLVFYRNVGIFHENLTNKVLDDFVNAVKPRWAKIESKFNARGGINTSVLREYDKKSKIKNQKSKF
ncbi:MAG: preQ(1) synthase [Candidatus Omnitrophota bacterium]